MDGLAHITRVSKVAKSLLREGGLIGCEHGDDQASEVRTLFLDAGFIDVETHLDLASRPRFVTARKPNMKR